MHAKSGLEHIHQTIFFKINKMKGSIERKTEVYGKQTNMDITNNESNSTTDDGMPSTTGKTQNIS
jgi:hypothetical protein